MNEREKGAQEWFRKVQEAMNHKQWDYAIECLANCVRLTPENLLFRQTKHGCIRKQYNDNKTGAKMAGMRLMGIKGRIKKSRMQKDWKNVEATAEEGLLVNPWDAQLMFDLGEACLHQGNLNVARYAMERAVEYDRDNIDYNRKLGTFLFEQRDYKAARACFERIYKLDPTDGEARAMMSRCDAESTMQKGYDDAENTRDVKVEQPQAPVNAYEADRQARKGAQKSADAPGDSAETDLLHAIRKDPKNLNLYLKLADLYKGNREFGKAQDQLNKALELSNNNPDIREQLLDVQLLLLKNELAEAVERMHKNPGKERLVEKANTLKAELLQKEIEFLVYCVELHPNEIRRKFELAQKYFESKQFAKAIPLLQQSVADSRLKVDALVMLGECFTKEGKLDLARRQFEKGLEGLSSQDNANAFKSAHYWLGRIYEKAGKKDLAEFHYGEILAVDYDYKDVLKRLEALQGDADQKNAGGIHD
jgi:tetratricopeptide (TPR) repeat protein